MTEKSTSESCDIEMENILKLMLERDQTITARGVIRLHPNLKAASSITRSPARSNLLHYYQTKQDELRGWRKRLTKRSRNQFAMEMQEKEIQISTLKRQVELLTASHVAMLRAVGELGGFSKWAQFYENYKEIRDELDQLKTLSENSSTEFKKDE